jgi:hypothetical protein
MKTPSSKYATRIVVHFGATNEAKFMEKSPKQRKADHDKWMKFELKTSGPQCGTGPLYKQRRLVKGKDKKRS